MSNNSADSNTEVITKRKTKVKEPPQFKVVLLNDDYTTMDFVISILETVFAKSPSEAAQIMLQVHRQGRGVCGIFTFQIAEAKIAQVQQRASSAGYPLQAVMENA